MAAVEGAQCHTLVLRAGVCVAVLAEQNHFRQGWRELLVEAEEE